MKDVRKSIIPSGVYKLNATCRSPFALIILLDECPYLEIQSKTPFGFLADLSAWKLNNLASLRPPVQIRFFIKKREKILEVNF